ncbi:MAG TPA: GDSL-type esterase/lipase family protein [Ktedonobacteraceae bacterium]
MSEKWITAWGMACCNGDRASANVGRCTTRTSVSSGINGKRLRLRLSNHYGKKNLVLGKVMVETGQYKGQACLDGKETIHLAAGEEMCTDALEVPVSAGEPISVSIYYPQRTRPISGNSTFIQTHSVPGDYTARDFAPQALRFAATRYFRPSPSLPEPLTTLRALDVCTEEENAFSVIALGDSITQTGYWVDPLREQLQRTYAGSATLLNMGISGNRLLLDTGARFLPGMFGQAGLERMDWDVFALAGSKAVVLALGINDIIQPGMGPMSPQIKERCSAVGLIAGYAKVIAACHAREIKVIGCTITPFGGMVTSNATTETIRQIANDWILHSGTFDATFDFAAIMADPADPTRLLPDYDSGDHLHPNAQGGKALADASDLPTLVAYL